ncbi:MAG: hypothetical protein MUD12_03045 [Spirochaetes bacterium]|nr:hypothetical protein [Spirochaetota bacterium]
MKRIITVILAVAFLITLKFDLQAGGSSNEKCKTKHPIMLVHGFMFRDSTFGIDYWGTIPSKLEEQSAKITRGGQNGWDSMLGGAETIWANVNKYFIEHPEAEKLNFICHSQGAIQFRLMYAIYKDQPVRGKPFRDRVASFTSITSPLRGTNIVTFIEDAAVGIVGEANRKYVGYFIEMIARIEGDTNPNGLGPLDMRPSRMTIINQQIKNLLGYDDLAPGKGITGVFCQSWIGRVLFPLTADPTINIGNLILNSYGDRPNDGVVPEASAPYAMVKGVVTGPLWGPGMGHQAMVDRGLLGLFHGGTPGFDVPEFYVNMVADLKAKGY